MEKKRVLILFADIQGSTEFGFGQTEEKYNEMLRDFHKTAHKTVADFKTKHGLSPEKIVASCRGDECCIFLISDSGSDDELRVIELAVYLKENWKASNFCKLNWQAADTGLVPQVDLRIGIGSGDVVFDDDVWSGRRTPEGIVISEAKRIEGLAHAAKETLIVVKWDIKAACEEARADITFGDVVRLTGKGIPGHRDTPLYPVVTYKKWERIRTEVVPKPTTPLARLSKAAALARSGDFEGAIDEYTSFLRRNKSLASAWARRADAYGKLKRYDEALADYNRALALRPDDPDTLNKRGVAYGSLKRYAEALADYNRALALRLDLPEALNNRGITYGGLKRYDEALADYNRALALRPDQPIILYNLACLHSLWNKADEAISYLERAIAGDKKFRQMAAEDKDFDPIRADPRFQKLVAGP